MFDGKIEKVSDMLKVLVNGRHYTTMPDKMKTRLQDKDEIALFPPVAGG